MPTGDSLPELVDVMDRLLAPDGCPWDREQTLDTLRSYLLEETHEVLEAIERGTAADHREELGDLLMQIVFQSAIRQREGAFTVDDVVRSIKDKLVRRHPHVFGDAKVKDSAEVLAQWSDIKAAEKKAAGKKKDRRILEGIPLAIPSLTRALRLSERAAQVGFDWPDVAGCRAKVAEELREVDQAIDQAIGSGDAKKIEEELGDLLFAIVSLARKLGHDPEAALRGANAKFEDRFAYIEDRLKERGRAPKESNLEEMDALWNDAKRDVRVTKK